MKWTQIGAVYFLLGVISLIYHPHAFSEGVSIIPKQPFVLFFPLMKKPIAVQLEVAKTQEEHQKGLMYRRKLASFAGMLFLFSPPQETQFWMKNTYIPLDLIFLDKQFQIVWIEENMTPLDETPKGPSKLVQYVIEVNGGFCKKHHIQIGTKAKLNMK